ncbi:MAG TPA: asparagine synthase (glutamine-hydrolyzing), partial [Bacteroidales bacterium]|nr:asparagine synthase (glutamine-hydrolyzing) [Bacteroidales bacterium]
MCGICGIIEKNRDNTTLMTEMLSIIEHRGPDSYSVFSHGDFCLGHRRLSIIDLSTGNQPIFNEDKTVCVVFNGEIYNYKEHKESLQAKGHQFYTTSDTEILVHLYEEYGTEFFSQLNGIFAFALLDMSRNRLILVRDHFGVKPLHYYQKDGALIFGSEQKSILLHPLVERKVNYKALHSTLNLRYTQMNETLFDGMKRLPPAHYLVYENGNVVVQPYWSLTPEPDHLMNEAEAIEKMHFYLRQAIDRQLMSDVPLGVYLSGGMDSSTIVQKMHELGVPEINTFTMGFNEPTDEFPDADMIAKHFGTNHHTLSLSMNPMQQFPQVIWHAEEPKINLLQGFNMSAFVRKDITVVLSGLGGDELFAGYDIHKFIYPTNWYHRNTPRWMQSLLNLKSSLLFSIQNASRTMSIDEYRRGLQMYLSIGNIEKFYLILRNVWDYDNGFYKNVYHPSMREKMKCEIPKVKAEFDPFFAASPNMKALDQVLYTEFQTKMVNDYLLTEDRMSMANSIEQRVPFLDLDLVKFGFSIPMHLKIQNNQTKYLFRKAMAQKLPQSIVDKKKWGFTVNPYLQFKKDLKTTAEAILTKEFVEQQGIFNYDYIKRILNHAPAKKMRWHYNFIWMLTGLAIWQKMYIDSDKFKSRSFDIND